MIQPDNYNIINWTKVASIIGISVTAWAIVKYVFGPLIKAQIISQLRGAQAELKELVDKIYFKEFADLALLRDNVNKLMNDTSRQNDILRDIEEKIDTIKDEVSYTRGVLDRRKVKRGDDLEATK